MERLHLMISSIAAIAGIGFATYQILNPSEPALVMLSQANPQPTNTAQTTGAPQPTSTMSESVKHPPNRQATSAAKLLLNLRTALAMTSAAYQADAQTFGASPKEAKRDPRRGN